MTRENLIKLIKIAYNDGYDDAKCNHVNDCDNYTNDIEYQDVGITRLEIINHNNTNGQLFGRMLTLHKMLGDFNNIELSYQDGRKTLKIFLD